VSASDGTVRTIAIITGTRAEFGLLRPVMHATAAHPALALRTIATGTHILAPARTIEDIAAEFTVDCAVPMQRQGVTGRAADAEALGRGITGIAAALAMLQPDVALVLGDRIEALAGALAASISGIRVAHIHGGDRAEGIADESMRHAITKLAHIHLPATPQSGQRIVTMGENPECVHIVGSPAIDGLRDMPPLADDEFTALGNPEIVFLMHPDNVPPAEMAFTAALILEQCMQAGATLALAPNFDAGRDVIMHAIEQSGCAARHHLPRRRFIGLLRRSRLLIGNSSAGLIEAAALGVPAINIGPRQHGRECAGNVVHVQQPTQDAIRSAIGNALAAGHQPVEHPFGDGLASQRIASTLADISLADVPLAKRNAY
jgi:UDP-hydrolysing UDP-N-acetyl-D-glucosamine 2-epimerase